MELVVVQVELLGSSHVALSCRPRSSWSIINSFRPTTNLASASRIVCRIRHRVRFPYRGRNVAYEGPPTEAAMPKAKTSKYYYAVARGRIPGIYQTWNECEAQVRGVSNGRHRKFNSLAEAETFVAQFGGSSSSVSSTTAITGFSASSRSKPYPNARLASSAKGKQRATDSRVLVDRTGWLTVYSDGACKGNGKPGSVAGVGVWWGKDDPRNIAERCPGGQTNNRGELIAIVRVLETTPKTKQPLLIKTDSKYSIQCFKDWLPRWRRNGFKTSTGGDVSNLGIIKYIDALLSERAKLGQKVEMEYVEGHMGHEGNEGADQLANQGCWLPEAPERDWESLEAKLREKIQGYRLKSLLSITHESISTTTTTGALFKSSPVKTRVDQAGTGLKPPAYEPLPNGWVKTDSEASQSSRSSIFSGSSLSIASTQFSVVSQIVDSQATSGSGPTSKSIDSQESAVIVDVPEDFFLDDDELEKELAS